MTITQAHPLATTDAVDAIERPDAAEVAAPVLPGRYLALADETLLPLTQPVTHIGRGFAATLQLEDPGVSRRHALVVQRRGRTRILDDRSANGVYVNGRRVLEAELQHGDVIALGRVTLVYVEVA